jgi:hypothetical protein
VTGICSFWYTSLRASKASLALGSGFLSGCTRSDLRLNARDSSLRVCPSAPCLSASLSW